MDYGSANTPACLLSLLITACIALPAFAQGDAEDSAATKDYSPKHLVLIIGV